MHVSVCPLLSVWREKSTSIMLKNQPWDDRMDDIRGRTQKMNLKGVYEIFYPGKEKNNPPVWKEKPKYRSKKDFFEEIIPMELRWLNIKIWSDKARRSRFFTDSKAEKSYVSVLKNYILQNPIVISRMENKGNMILKTDIFPPAMEQIFFQIQEQERISLSPALQYYLMEDNCLRENWGNVLAFWILYSIFPEEVNQIYVSYLYRKENEAAYDMKAQGKRDSSLFQYEYPPDMSVHKPGEWITHTWVMKNAGEIPWKNRRFECVTPSDWLNEESRTVKMKEIVYPGDTVSPTVHFRVPDTPGHYALNWKMKNKAGEILYTDKVGLGLHFTVLEEGKDICDDENNNYRILEEKPSIPATLIAGEIYEHNWIIENTGTVIWEDYYCECINGDTWGYSRNELQISMKKKIEPGERINIQIEFVTPPIEGSYRLIWRIMKKGGKPVFPEGRQLEVVLNLI